ncbi:helix-turn-helix transcriptional regulator [Streptomyces sp. R302]|uniref:helix-turn-helix domain-containing protein n=1 Tax=unclassified Streptomyces TaxID=2593676 RepID=UPI00145DB181|nr:MULTISPECIES: helix-turn-helix transcriptional regulator [unclassified Streptomyces]NML55303.1 helix-turn-helix transcriptional regulator [Streptomyces sp. R301]NML80175.1 helix-turn-helix transcriptional regulator [Streptomyces sp. R302]
MNPQIDPKRLARRRVEAGLSMTDLGQRAGVSKQHVSMVERGRANFSPRNMAKIATALDCTIADLLADAEPEVAPQPETPSR